MQNPEGTGVVKALCSVVLCIPEFLTLLPRLLGFNAYSNSLVISAVILCFLVSIGLAQSAIRKGNDAAWALGFLALGLHITFLAKLLTTQTPVA